MVYFSKSMRWLIFSSFLFLSACNTEKVAQLEKENKELQARLAAQEGRNLLDLQDRCSQQARLYFKSQGPWDNGTITSYTNHYNQRLNKCFIQLNATAFSKGSIFVSVFINDAFEGRDYGEYHSMAKYPEEAPAMCTVTSLPAAQATTCHSQKEFDELIKQYMEQ